MCFHNIPHPEVTTVATGGLRDDQASGGLLAASFDTYLEDASLHLDAELVAWPIELTQDMPETSHA